MKESVCVTFQSCIKDEGDLVRTGFQELMGSVTILLELVTECAIRESNPNTLSNSTLRAHLYHNVFCKKLSRTR